jgi:hypothetical protein
MIPADFSMGTGLAIFGLAFGAWAWVVAWGVGVVRKEVQDMKGIGNHTTGMLTSHINQTERRLTMLETEFRWLKDSIKERAGQQ